MQVTIAAVGRMKSGPEADLLAGYLKRIRQAGGAAGISGVRLAEFDESRQSSAAARRAEEAGWLLAAVPDSSYVVALDERGEWVPSAGFAGMVRTQLEGGVRDIAFVLGGPDGLDSEVRNAARRILSFGQMTWPHRLARAMLAEQVYRAVTILVNHPYHRS